MKPYLFLIIVLTLSYSMFGQTNPCPELTMQNLRLGMTQSEAESALGQKLELKKSETLSIPTVKTSTFNNRDILFGVAEFYKGSLYKIVAYYERTSWDDMHDFTKTLSEAFKVKGKWLYHDKREGYEIAELKCSAYSIGAVKVGMNYSADITDHKITTQIKRESQKARQDKKKTFKP